MRVYLMHGADVINFDAIQYNWAQHAVLKIGAVISVPSINKSFKVKDITVSQSCVYVYLEDHC